MRSSARATALVVLALTLAACGGEDDTATDVADEPVDETDEATDDDPVEATDDEPVEATDDEPVAEADDEASADEPMDDEPADDEPMDDEPADEQADEQADEGSADADLAIGSTTLGEILVDGEGMTLYLFTNDPEGESVCEDDCVAAWPPLQVEGEPALGDGVDADLVSTITRPDGSTQVAYDGAPLYTWASDEEPGDVTGQGVQDVWYVVAPDGTAVTEEPTASGAADAEPDVTRVDPAY